MAGQLLQIANRRVRERDDLPRDRLVAGAQQHAVAGRRDAGLEDVVREDEIVVAAGGSIRRFAAGTRHLEQEFDAGLAPGIVEDRVPVLGREDGAALGNHAERVAFRGSRLHCAERPQRQKEGRSPSP